MATINCKTTGGTLALFMLIIHQIKNAFIEKKSIGCLVGDYDANDFQSTFYMAFWRTFQLWELSESKQIYLSTKREPPAHRAHSWGSYLASVFFLFISSISFLHLLYNHTENMAILLTSKYSFGVKYFMHNLCINNFQHNEWKNQWLGKYIIYINYERRKLNKKQNGCRN